MSEFELYTEILVKSVFIFLSLIICIRICGLKSFSKMTSFDFAITIAIGSILASTIISKSIKLEQGIAAIAIVFLLQYLIGYFRKRYSRLNDLLNNKPVLLFRDGEFIKKNLDRCDIAEADVIAKFREANALNLQQIHAVIFESTGYISVLHGEKKLDGKLLEGVDI